MHAYKVPTLRRDQGQMVSLPALITEAPKGITVIKRKTSASPAKPKFITIGGTKYKLEPVPTPITER